MTDKEKKLEDFGEHIAGAKKETYFRAIDPTSEEAKTLPLSKLWTDKDIKAIEDIEIASIAHTLRDALPTRPRNRYKLNRWLDEVSKSQKVVISLLEKDDPVFTELVMKELEKTRGGNKSYLLTKLDREDWKKVGDVRFLQNTNENNTVYLSVQLKGERHSFYPKEPVTIKNYNAKAIIDEFAGEIQTILKDKEKHMATREMTASSFDIYTRRRDDTAFICAKTDRQKTPLIEFETLAEAREYKKDPENIAELSRRWTAHREHNSITKTDMRNAVNEERTGQSYRNHDITPDEFMAIFGVRGGQFGNWVTGDERQQMLNNAYDGFMDLSKALKIDPKAIGLNGRLGIAFGARGSGSASAHYETDEKVINLTKTRGAGSLAHEWWHALDHSMSSTVELTTKNFKTWASPQGNKLREDIRTEPMNDSLKLLMNTIKNSDLQKRSQTADAYRSPAYFSTNVEMTARAFEGHIQHTLSTMGIKNDFLVNIKAEKDWQKNLDAYPYPKADELEQFSKAYNAVFDTLRETDKEFIPVHYEPEPIIHADTLAVTGAEKIKEKQEHTKQSVNTANEPQAQTVGETTPIQQPQEAEQPTQPTPVAQQQQATAYTPNISQYDTKLNTPYAEKNQAKTLGAKWDNANKTWYAPAGLDLNKFEKWLPKEKEQSKQSSDKLANSPAQTPQGQTNAIPQAQRLYLYTRPSDNEKMQELKAQGIIKFDLPNKLWYAHSNNAEAVKEWTTRPNVPTPEQALTEHLRNMGIRVDAGHPIFDDRPHRLSNDGSTDKNVMYHAYANQGGVPYARITNFSRNGVSEWTYPAEYLSDLRTIEAVDRAMGQSYTNRSTPTANAPQTAPQNQNLPQERQEPPKDEAKIALENLMAERAKMVMSLAPIADNNQNYLDKKQVTANGVAHIVPSSDKIPEHLQSHIAIGNTPKQYFWLLANNPENKLVLQRGNLVIPQYNAQGEMRAFETIAYNGRKYALKDAEKKSMMTVLGSLENGKPIVITEGYATGATLHEHTGRNVVVAFGKNGLMDIAKELRDNYPDSKIYIGADNDHNKEQNYGLQNALAVQGAVKNVYVLTPQFEAGDTGKDWNDVLVDKGVDELKRQLTEQLLAINPDAKKTKQEIRAEPVHAPIQAPQDPLSLEAIKQNYPTMSDSNLQAIQAWKVEIDTRYTSDPYRQETSINRLIAKLPDLAQGEQLPFPKSQAMQEHKPPEPTVTAEATQPQTNQPTTPQAEEQHSINGGGGRKW